MKGLFAALRRLTGRYKQGRAQWALANLTEQD